MESADKITMHCIIDAMTMLFDASAKLSVVYMINERHETWIEKTVNTLASIYEDSKREFADEALSMIHDMVNRGGIDEEKGSKLASKLQELEDEADEGIVSATHIE